MGVFEDGQTPNFMVWSLILSCNYLFWVCISIYVYTYTLHINIFNYFQSCDVDFAACLRG